ncbi:MAG: DUF5660 family protein [Patescibacteria group bacterium]
MNTKTKKKYPDYSDKNPLEALKGVGSGVLDSAVNDFAKQGVSDLWEQLLGASSEDKHRNEGDLEEGQEINLKKHDKSEKREHAAPAMNYHQEIVEVEKRASRETQQELHSKIQEILVELKKISETSTEISMEFKEVTIEQRIEKPGEYHVNFFAWMLSVIRAARTRIEDSGAWLNTMKSKKGQKNYWQMFKKHGTSFGLSNERVVATQVG